VARGWESKSVEEQIAAAGDRMHADDRGPDLSADERARLLRIGSLNMARARILQQLQGACNARYRAQLEQALADVDAGLREADAAGRAR
jgi:hypothetical protein